MVAGDTSVCFQLAGERVPVVLTGDDKRDRGREGFTTREGELAGHQTLQNAVCSHSLSTAVSGW